MARIVSNWSEIDLEVERISSLAIIEAHAGLDRVLEKGADMVRGSIHVETGALKDSVATSTSTAGAANWHGEITVGGNLRYAWYEYRRRGGHSYFYPLPLLHQSYIDAILDGLRK